MFTSETFGHLHPLIIHLPIGILLFGFLLLLVQRVKKIDLEASISLAFLTGSITAAAACVAGWLLAQSGEYEETLILNHQWTGIAATALGFLTFFTGRYRMWLASCTVVLLSIAGHFGGTLTHGEGYLFSTKTISEIDLKVVNAEFQALDSGAVQSQVADAQTSTPLVFVYRDEVVPILKKKCYSCHSATKMKGGLRLDSEDFIKKGGKNGRILSAGHPANSTLVKNLMLPLNEDAHMPPKGKPQLTRREIAILHAWVRQGASFVAQPAEKKGETPLEFLVPEEVVDGSGKTELIRSSNSIEEKLLQRNAPPISGEIVSELQKKNVLIRPLNQSSSLVAVNFVNVNTFETALVDELKSLENHIMWLRLTNQPVTDEDVKKLSTCSNLTRLNLENTRITDKALGYLKSLKNLEQLNLYGTAITDAGLKELVNFPALKKVYLWQTKATENGLLLVQKARPEMRVEGGEFQFNKPDSSTIQK